MKPLPILAAAVAALVLSGCQSMYVGGSVGTSVGSLASSAYKPKFLPVSDAAAKAGYVCGDTDCVDEAHGK